MWAESECWMYSWLIWMNYRLVCDHRARSVVWRYDCRRAAYRRLSDRPLRLPPVGDLWSFNSSNNEYVVSPEPDLDVLTVDVTQHRCLVLGTDGFWNMVSPQLSVSNVAHAELFNEECLINHTNTGEVRPDRTSPVDTVGCRWCEGMLTSAQLFLVPVSSCSDSRGGSRKSPRKGLLETRRPSFIPPVGGPILPPLRGRLKILPFLRDSWNFFHFIFRRPPF